MNLKQNNIAIIAVGGGGSNILNSLIETRPYCSNTMAINIDQIGLNRSKANTKIKLKGNASSEITRMKDGVAAFLKNKNGLILLACLGGMTGSHITSPIAATAKALNIPTLAIISLPFDFEGKQRMEQAKVGQAGIQGTGVRTAIYSCEEVAELVGKENTLEDMFQRVDMEIIQMIYPYLQGGSHSL